MLELTPEEKEKVSTLSSPTASVYEPNPNSQKSQESTPDGGTDKEDAATGGEVAVEVEYASGLKLAAVVAALALSVFLVSLDMTIVATAIPKITDVSFPHAPTRTISTDTLVGF